VDWLKCVITRRIGEAADVERLVAAAVAEGVGQCLRFGVTSVGDISRMCQLTRPILARCPLRVVSYGEVQGMGQRRGAMEERLATAADGSCATERLRIGITPHAPYSIELAGYARCLEVAQQRGLPLATHLGESADEAAFLAQHAGPFRELWDFLGWWDEQVPRFEGGPIRLAQSLGLLDYATLLAHVNYCDDEELAILSRGRASVVYCPRTHAYFGHPPHRWREMLKRGINVAVGTDSCASSPDLNLVDDLRLMHRIAPEVATQRLWEMATVRAARAIGEEQKVGSITPGKAADLVAFAVRTCDPLTEVLEGNVVPQKIWVGGIEMTKDETRMTNQ
jgi:cytosine/adenosine deaminase-related metal-dependent hydrolase